MNERQILTGVLMLIPMVLSLTVHEFCHAAAAKALKDDTAERMGRLTLNPIPHIDPIGTIALPLMASILGGAFFGWAKPVPVNPMNFTRKISMKMGMLWVAAAGPASNMVLALISSVLIYVLAHWVGVYNDTLHQFFQIFIHLNVLLAFFNLLPVPPLDGGRILTGLLPDRFGPMLEGLERYGFLILIVLLFSGALSVLFIPVRYIAAFLLYWPLEL